MLKNISPFKVLGVLSCFTFISLLNSCDTRSTKEDIETFQLDPRYDPAELESNPDAVAEMPPFLLPGDVITHSVAPGSPMDVRGFKRGFDAERQVVNTAGQLTIAEGSSTFPNYNYIYNPANDEGEVPVLRLAEFNGYDPIIEPEAVREDFELRLEAIEATPVAGKGSLQDALLNILETPTDVLNDIIVTAVESQGFLANDQGDSGGGFFPEEISTNTVLRRWRIVRYNVTSTNRDILENNRISGTISVIDSYINIRVLYGDDRGLRVSLEPARRNNVPVAESFDEDAGVVFTGLLQSDEISNGTFSIDLIRDDGNEGPVPVPVAIP